MADEAERPTIVIELASDARFARDLAAGGVFVPGCALAMNSECALVVRGPHEELELTARVVYVDPKTGAGFELVGFGPALRDHLAKLMSAWGAPGATDDTDEPAQSDADTAANAADADAERDAAAEDAADPEPDAEPDPERRKIALNMQERLRGLSVSQQVKAARSSDPQERIVLERIYNKNVWEPLLRNPRLTPPEVARMARMGTLPRVLLEIIVGNGAWLQVPEVRRALLANPRLGTDQIIRVLRMLPKHELKLASTQTAYPHAVRDAARRLLKD
ncbi:MAG: hypothetical protein H0T89_08075 [Deltaproteobacteria bacterium]|nr:hypothetical protein [Deltaproteobacteria bacterium]